MMLKFIFNFNHTIGREQDVLPGGDQLHGIVEDEGDCGGVPGKADQRRGGHSASLLQRFAETGHKGRGYHIRCVTS